MIKPNSMSSVKYIVANYLKVLKIPEPTIPEMLTFLECHPNYPSLRSIVECFEEWQIKSTAATATIDQLISLGGFFIAYLGDFGGSFVFVIKAELDQIIYLNPTGEIVNESYDEFAAKWNNVVFVGELSQNSGKKVHEAGWKDNIYSPSLYAIKKVSFNQEEPGTYKLFRRVSIFASYILIRLRLGPNSVSALWLAALLGASFMISTGTSLKLRILTVILICLHFVLDCADGEVARITKKTSRLGNYFENWIHWTTNLTLILGVSLGLFKQSADPAILKLGMFCLLGDSCFHFLYISLNSWLNEEVDYGWLHKLTGTIYVLMPLNTNIFLLGCLFNLLYLSLFSWCVLSSVLFLLLSISFFCKEFSILKRSR